MQPDPDAELLVSASIINMKSNETRMKSNEESEEGDVSKNAT